MAHFMISDALALLRAEQAAMSFCTGSDALHRFCEIVDGHFAGIATSGEDRRLVDEIGKISAGKSGRDAGDLTDIQPGAVLTCFMCTFRIASRPLRSDRSSTTCRSNRPARVNAGSSISGRLVA